MSLTVEDRPPVTARSREPRQAPEPAVDDEGDERRGSPWARRLALAVALVLLAGLLALVFGPGRGMRSDIDRQVELTQTQLELSQEQLAIARRQLAIAEEQRKMTLEMLAIARDQLAIAREQLERSDQTIQMQREALEISRATLAEAREMNRKTPDANPRGGVLEGQP